MTRENVAMLVVGNEILGGSTTDTTLAAFDTTHSSLDVYLKSRAKRFGPYVRRQATISTRGANLDDVIARIDAAIDAFRALLADASIEVPSVVYDE